MTTRWFLRALLLAFFLVAGLCPEGHSASTSITISQLYSSQFADALLKNDFIELFNLSDTAVNMNGWTLQIAAGSSAGWRAIPLSGSLGPGQYYLVSAGASISGSALIPLPAGDSTGSVPLDSGGGRVALVNNATLLPTPCPNPGQVVEVLSYGPSGCDSGIGNLSPGEALIRSTGGCAGPYALAAPYPRTKNAPPSLCTTPDASSRVAFAVPAEGGYSRTTPGSGSSVTVGSARVEPSSGSTPDGLAIFGYRSGGTLVSETTVPATPLFTAALIYVEVNSPSTTGIAISNPTNADVTLRFTFRDLSGLARQSGFLTIQANAQLARFVNEMPMNLTNGSKGALELSSPVPVGVLALRGLTNERSEFLVTTIPVLNLNVAASTAPAYLAHFAVEGGWRTSILLLNSSNLTQSGTVEFRDSSGSTISLPFFGGSSSSLPYSIPSRSSLSFTFTGTGTVVKTGTVRVSPTGESTTPTPVAVFAFRRNNVTVSEAGLAGITGSSFRTYMEASGTNGAVGSIQSGLAIGNVNSQATTVDLDLARLDGTTDGLPGRVTVSIPGSGQLAKFLNELFPSLAASFQGILRVSTPGSITLVGLRGRFNERSDFLITTVPPVSTTVPAPATGLVFPHLADSGGYTTQFVLFGSGGQPSSGTLRSINPAGRPLALFP